MAELPQSLYGKVHCISVIEFSANEEADLLREYDKPSIVERNREPSRGSLFGL